METRSGQIYQEYVRQRYKVTQANETGKKEVLEICHIQNKISIKYP